MGFTMHEKETPAPPNAGSEINCRKVRLYQLGSNFIKKIQTKNKISF